LSGAAAAPISPGAIFMQNVPSIAGVQNSAVEIRKSSQRPRERAQGSHVGKGTGGWAER
jgi:hypothetical protein